MGFCSHASLLLYFSLELHDPWQPKGSSEKITFQRLPFSSLSLAVKVQVSPEFQDALFWVPLGFSHLPRFYETPNISIGLVVPLMSLYFWVFLLLQRKPPRDWKLQKKESHLMRQTFKLYPHTPFFKHLITLGASALFYLSGKKISLVDQGVPVSLLSLQRSAEPWGPGNCCVFLGPRNVALLLPKLPRCSGMWRRQRHWLHMDRSRTLQFLTQHSCIL